MSDAIELARPFARSQLRDQSKGGTTFTYIPAAELIVRLNSVLGVGGWSTEAEAFRDGDWVIGKVRLLATVDGKQCEAVQYGGVKIKKTRDGDPLDLGDEFKGAVSDALKKAAQQLGCGLYLARSTEAKREVPQAEPTDG